MFIDAIKSKVDKSKNPQLNADVKKKLEEELNQLDQDGSIRRFLEGKGPKPDLTHLFTPKFFIDPKSEKYDEKELSY
jgi:hypothetical protein